MTRKSTKKVEDLNNKKVKDLYDSNSKSELHIYLIDFTKINKKFI